MGNTRYVTITEDDNDAFAVIKAKQGHSGILIKGKKLKKNIALAVKEHFCYDRVEFVEWAYNESMNQMVFDCYGDGDIEEIRAIDLSLIALYK